MCKKVFKNFTWSILEYITSYEIWYKGLPSKICGRQNFKIWDDLVCLTHFRPIFHPYTLLKTSENQRLNRSNLASKSWSILLRSLLNICSKHKNSWLSTETTMNSQRWPKCWSLWQSFGLLLRTWMFIKRTTMWKNAGMYYTSF